MCKFCDNFAEVKFDEEYKELISMDEEYDNMLEEKISTDIYIFKPKFTSAIFLTLTIFIFDHDIIRRIEITHCPMCGKLIKQNYFKQQDLFPEQ